MSTRNSPRDGETAALTLARLAEQVLLGLVESEVQAEVVRHYATDLYMGDRRERAKALNAIAGALSA